MNCQLQKLFDKDLVVPGKFFLGCLKTTQPDDPVSYWIVLRVSEDLLPPIFLETKEVASRTSPFWVVGHTKFVWLPRTCLYYLHSSQKAVFEEQHRHSSFPDLFHLATGIAKARPFHFFSTSILEAHTSYEDSQHRLAERSQKRKRDTSPTPPSATEEREDNKDGVIAAVADDDDAVAPRSYLFVSPSPRHRRRASHDAIQPVRQRSVSVANSDIKPIILSSPSPTSSIPVPVLTKPTDPIPILPTSTDPLLTVPALRLPKPPQSPVPPPAPILPQLPKHPQVPKPPRVPVLPQVPVPPQRPALPQVPKPPRAPLPPQVPVLPQSPKPPQLPVFPQIPKPPRGPVPPQLSKPLQIPIPPQEAPQKSVIPFAFGPLLPLETLPLPQAPASLSRDPAMSVTSDEQSQPSVRGFRTTSEEYQFHYGKTVRKENRVHIFVGEEQYLTDKIALRKSAVLTSFIRQYEDGTLYIMNVNLKYINIPDFLVMLEYIQSQEYAPALIKAPEDDAQRNAPNALQGYTTAEQYSQELVRSARLYVLSKYFQVDGFATHIMRKVNTAQFRPYSRQSMLEAAGVVFRTNAAITQGNGDGHIENRLDTWLVYQLAEGHRAIMDTERDRNVWNYMAEIPAYNLMFFRIHLKIADLIRAKSHPLQVED